MAIGKQTNFNLVEIIVGLARFAVLCFALVLTAVCISNFALFSPNWPFGLFASFSLYLIFVSPIFVLICIIAWRKSLMVLLPLGVVAFYPFYDFKKYDFATKDDCQTIECLTLVSVNLHHDIEALKRVSKISRAFETDLFLLMDLPYDLSETKLRALYPFHPNVRVFARTRDGKPLGSAMAVVSKDRATDLELIEDNLDSDDFNLRGLIRFSYPGELNQPIDIFIIHPMMPLAKNGMTYRDKLIDRAVSEIGESENFILVGDFNLTPWEPKFKTLPGIRAENPRWISTWDASRAWLRLPIDHVMVGRGIQTVESEVLPSVGSDHYPIYTVVTRRRTN